MSKIHYIRMNGSSGCMPDSLDVHDTLRSAIESATCIFDDISDKELKQMKRDLRVNRIHYFDNRGDAGADYVEISSCNCGNIIEHEE